MNEASMSEPHEPSSPRVGASSTLRSPAELRARAEQFVREQPLVAIAGAGVVGALLGGTVLRRASQLLFLTAAGFVLTELWKREGRMDVQGLVGHLTEDEPTRR